MTRRAPARVREDDRNPASRVTGNWIAGGRRESPAVSGRHCGYPHQKRSAGTARGATSARIDRGVFPGFRCRGPQANTCGLVQHHTLTAIGSLFPTAHCEMRGHPNGSRATTGGRGGKGRMILASCSSGSNPTSVEESTAAEQQHNEDDDDQSGRVHFFLSPVFGERDAVMASTGRS